MEKQTKSEIKRLSRYTTLPVLLDLLERKKLTLLNPELWDDKNDSLVILAYKQKKNIKNLFAICMSHGDETVHHWKTFSNGTSGCVIEFDAERLFMMVEKIPNLRHAKVQYRKLSDVENKKSIVEIDQMPFTKRWPYRCEEEYRIIVTDDSENDFFDIPITLDIIKRITISQQMPEPVYKTIKEYLKSANGDPKRKINRSTLYENKRWISRFNF